MILKHIPEDFIVEEIPLKDWDDAGPYAVFKLIKRDLNTEKAIEIISKRFHIPHNDIKYSGTKDRHAYTTQYISIPSRNNIDKISLDEDNLKLQHVGFTDAPLSLGTLKGNRFIIIVREITRDELTALRSNNRYSDNFIVPNYFDEQRFSTNNYNIGLCILKKDYKSAVRYMCESSDAYADIVRIYLAANPNDYVGALRHIPKKILLMLIHSVQSFIFNEALSKILSEYASEKAILHKVLPYSLGSLIYYDNPSTYDCSMETLQLVGFDTADSDHHIKKLLEDIGLTPRDFIIKAIPDLSVEGTTRECFVDVKNLDIKILNDRAIIEFELPKGAYATNVIKALMN